MNIHENWTRVSCLNPLWNFHWSYCTCMAHITKWRFNWGGRQKKKLVGTKLGEVTTTCESGACSQLSYVWQTGFWFILCWPDNKLLHSTLSYVASSLSLEVKAKIVVSYLITVDCKTVRIFAFQESASSQTKGLERGWKLRARLGRGDAKSFFCRPTRLTGVRLAHFARLRFLRHALPISLLILRRKKTTVLQFIITAIA